MIRDDNDTAVMLKRLNLKINHHLRYVRIYNRLRFSRAFIRFFSDLK